MNIEITEEMRAEGQEMLNLAFQQVGNFINENKSETFEELKDKLNEEIEKVEKKYNVELKLTIPTLITKDSSLPFYEKPEDFKSAFIYKSAFEDYLNSFVQRLPSYTVKRSTGGTWKTKNKALSDMPIKAHLSGKYDVGVLGKWYPEYAVLDIDSQSKSYVNEVREVLQLNEENSMLFSSESPDSFHLLIKPQYNENPPTVRLLQEVFKGVGKQYGFEIYPQSNKTIRLPFGPKQKPLDEGYVHLPDWKNHLYWFLKLNDFDLSTVKNHQMFFEFDPIGQAEILPSVFDEGRFLLKEGLQVPSSREEAQWKILHYLWRLNVSRSGAEETVWNWIQEKHNGFSKDIQRSHRAVKSHISRQAFIIYDKYEAAYIYPDSTHNSHNGYITNPDIKEIVEATKASLPRMRFLFHLVKFSYPRRFRTFVNVHSDQLISWASRDTYLKYLSEFEETGLVKRGTGYLTGKFSKDLKLSWNFRDSRQAVLYEGRSVDTFDDTLRLLFKPDEFKQMISAAGVKRTTAIKAVKSIFEGVKKQ